MKIYIYLFCFLSLVSIQSFAQFEDRPPHHFRDKIFQLEKIKLIETLQMDEETTLRFFARRSETETAIDSLRRNLDALLDKINQEISGDSKTNDEELKTLIKKVSEIRLKIDQKRVDFVNSLSDILTTKQIAKFVVFEKKFRDDLAKSLMKDRMRKKRD
jgi:hypothetical protein